MSAEFEAQRTDASQAADEEVGGHALAIISILYNRVVTGAAPSVRRHLGLSLTEARIVFFLGASGAITANQLARDFGLDKAAISRCINRLIEMGLVVSVRDRRHAGRNRLSLTDAGQTSCDAVAHFTFARERHLLSVLSAKEQRIFLESLRKILTMVDSTNNLVEEGHFWPRS
ncbi:MarR family winged helix-turn-helix transcriptional regulator [Sphingomonas sp. ZT3P38]|uniref:MarR family winged helix-turn-helix transcriptional regulator n=1 Tax=Parasphingomonas zepuensis TaxID=3096161 RepID=UPI002FCA8767